MMYNQLKRGFEEIKRIDKVVLKLKKYLTDIDISVSILDVLSCIQIYSVLLSGIQLYSVSGRVLLFNH